MGSSVLDSILSSNIGSGGPYRLFCVIRLCIGFGQQHCLLLLRQLTIIVRIRSFIHMLVHSFSNLFIRSFVCTFVHSFVRSLIRSFIQPLIHSFCLISFFYSSFFYSFIYYTFVVRSFARSFVHSLIYLLKRPFFFWSIICMLMIRI